MTHADTHEPGEELTDEEELEITDEEGQAATQKDKLKQLREQLKAVNTEKRELLEEVQRIKADFLNSKKRLEEQQKAALARSENAFVAALLPLADSFTMAMKDTAAWEATDEAWRKGVEGIHTQLERILAAHNVSAINPVSESFDPERHEAVGTTEHESESETVVDVVQLGYERNGTILRPAKVVISS
ncbi:nucleotide exchange factor GrpE [bacterium]|nr:nucleotide exchange factor GrpE [bacterium]|tara:strand:- start:323 stop:886 length:564 start_codon:yes stop_codon:yes gene_type:complete